MAAVELKHLLAKREDVEFISEGTVCRGWLYSLNNPSDSGMPAIVMAHGFGGTKDMLLAPFAQRFVEAGYAVLIFDYRSYGASDGVPRNNTDPKWQIEDWRSALRYIRTLSFVDNQRIALWGTSFSGGVTFVVAAMDKQIAASVHMNPMMDGVASLQAAQSHTGIIGSIKMGRHILQDIMCSLFGLDPHYMPIFEQLGNVGAETTEDAWEAYQNFPKDCSFENRVTARSLIKLSFFRPVNYAKQVNNPTLFQLCKQDDITPSKPAHKAASICGGQPIEYDTGHFGIYAGSFFDSAITDQLAFFKQNLLDSKVT